MKQPRTVVWGGNLVLGKGPLSTVHGQCHLIVRSRSRAAAVRALQAAGFVRVTNGFLRDYWSETGNPNELSTATTEGEIWVTSGLLGGAFRAMRLAEYREAS